jgi:DNA invertase Pin-like site-specific DNA recombinase
MTVAVYLHGHLLFNLKRRIEMARKSRKSPARESNHHSRICWAAGYIRLSVAKEGQSPDSIENQMRIIEQYVSTQSDILFYKFYIDKNARGTDFEREAFQEMLNDINRDKINCVVVKDLSRLGRVAIETGYFIEQYFPSRRVRFISISDRFDTIDGVTNVSFDKMSGIRIPITNIFNEKVVEDIRAKTQVSINSNILEGKYVAPRAPYGYKKSLNDCHVLIPDQVAADVVKNIFAMASEQVGLNEIVRRLNTSKMLTPIDYARANGLDGNYKQGNGLWNTRTVKYILTNRTYTGDLEQGTEQVIVRSTHEPLVSLDMYDTVQKLMKTSSDNTTNVPRSDNLLRGKVICGSCGNKMQRRKGSGTADWNFFTCITNNRMGNGHCTGMYIRETDVMAALCSSIARHIEKNKSLALEYACNKSILAERSARLNSELQEMSDDARVKYEQYVSGVLSAEQYQHHNEIRDSIKVEIRDVEAQMFSLDNAQAQYQLFCEVLQDGDGMERLIGVYLQAVTVRENRRVDISFN